MHFNILTVFPEMFPGTLDKGVVGRALDKNIWSYNAINIRDFAINNYGSVDEELVWETATEDIPALLDFCTSELNRMERNNDEAR